MTKYKFINLAIGVSALLLYEFFGRPVYRPYIYNHKLYDFHIADTLGNSLGTIAAIFVFIALLTSNKHLGNVLLKVVTIAFVIYEIGQPLLGKPIDVWDIAATFFAAILSYFIYNFIFRPSSDVV